MKNTRILNHYLKNEVIHEIVEFSKDKWIAVHCNKSGDDGKQLMFRYFPNTKKPLKINSEEDFKRLLMTMGEYEPRTFYASINIYGKIDRLEDVFDRDNIVRSTPTWDIDSLDDDHRKVIHMIREIVEVLDRFNISKSIIIKWSGRGAHIHIHPNAFSPELYSKIDPLDVAYSVTEYVLRKVIVIEGVKVENKIDLGRVFTTPLSIHRELDRVAVCIDLDKLEEFDLSWTEINNFRHSSSWRKYDVGEADELADKAFIEVGPYIYKARRKRVHKPLDKQIIDTFNRFKDLL